MSILRKFKDLIEDYPRCQIICVLMADTACPHALFIGKSGIF